MKITINCAWVSPQKMTMTDGIEVLMNTYDPESAYVVDLACLFSPLASSYPPNKRVMATAEPSGYMGYTDDLISKIGSFYGAGILSWHSQLKHLPQTKPFRMGSSWVTWSSDPSRKEFGIGGIFSGKNAPGFPGYVFRKQIISRQSEIKTPGTVFSPTGIWHGVPHEYPQKSKEPSLRYMYHFAVENCREEGYFTEKLLDCFLTYSIPLYYGDPLIGNVFLTDGMIMIDENNFIDKVNSLTPELYRSKAGAMEENRRRAEKYWHFEDNVVEHLKTFLGVR